MSRLSDLRRRDAKILAQREHYAANRQEQIERKRQWRALNRERYNAENRERYAVTREKNCARARKWCKDNPEKNTAKTALRRARKLNATPSWLTKAQKRAISKFYEQAQIQGLTVYHIIPLRGKAVCGLHVPWNLQLLTKGENSRKGIIVGAT